MTPSPAGQYKVSCAAQQLAQLKAWGKKAAERGLLDAFLAALQTINENLTADPVAWGDPYFHLRQSGLLFCHRIQAMLHLYYAVDEKKKVVIVKEFRLLPGGPLDEPG